MLVDPVQETVTESIAKVGKKTLKRVDYKYDARKYNHLDLAKNWEKLNVIGAIPKIPMPPSLMRVRGLFQEDFEDICEYGEAYCDISDPVAGLLQWQHLASSECGMIGRNDNFLSIITKVSGATLIRDKNDVGSVSGKRPDACVLQDGVPLFRLEEKYEQRELQTAKLELKYKMVHWLQQYGNIPCVIAVVIAGNTLALYRINAHLDMKLIAEHLDMSTLAARTKTDDLI